MGIMTIDGQRVDFTDEPNVLSVIRKAGIEIPTLCYHSERKDICLLFGKTKRRNGDLYKYA